MLGTVHDPSGAPIAKVNVTLLNQDTGIEAKTITDDAGNYDFFNVKVGRYTITAEHPGFSKFTTTDVRVDVDARQRVDVALQVGAVTTSVEVSGAAAVLETDTSEHGQVINTQQVVELPLNGRNYADLALLSTNVVKSPMAVSFSASGTPREAAFNVNGMRSTYNNFLLDGVDNNYYGTSNQGYSSQVVQPSPDAIAEFKVITSELQRRIRARGRRGGERGDEIGNQPVSRSGLRVSAQHRSERGRLSIQPRGIPEADAAAQSVRRRDRRTDHQEQAVLLRRLRRLPPVAALSQFRFDSEHDRPRGNSAGDRGRSA